LPELVFSSREAQIFTQIRWEIANLAKKFLRFTEAGRLLDHRLSVTTGVVSTAFMRLFPSKRINLTRWLRITAIAIGGCEGKSSSC
jgi:hypothetical protein